MSNTNMLVNDVLQKLDEFDDSAKRMKWRGSRVEYYEYLDTVQKMGNGLIYDAFWSRYEQYLKTKERSTLRNAADIARTVILSRTPRGTRFGGMLLLDRLSPVDRGFVAEWMEEAGEPDGIPYLEATAKDKRNLAEVRSRACRALGATKDEKVVAVLSEILEEQVDSKYNDQYDKDAIDNGCLQGLVLVGSLPSKKLIIHYLQDEDRVKRQLYALHIIDAITPVNNPDLRRELIHALRKLTKHEDPRFHPATTNILEEILGHH